MSGVRGLDGRLGALLELQRPHPGVRAGAGKKLGVRATLDNAPALEDEDLIGIDDRR
jgi:hypothetical protein